MLRQLKVVWFLVVMSMVVLMTSVAVAQDGEAIDTPLDPPETVTVAYVPILKFAPLFVAAERGLFEQYGLDVQIEKVASGTEAIAFLTEGQVDVGGIAIVTSLWNGWSQEDLDIRILAPGGLEPLEDSPTKLLVREDLFKDGSVTKVEDLKGQIVAVAGGPGSGGEYLLAKALELGDLTIFDVETQNIDNADMPAAFANDAVAAAIIGAPYADQIIEAGDGVSIATDLTPGLMTVAFVGSGKFVTERPEVAQRFVLALLDASRLMQGEDFFADENMAAYLAYTNTTEEAIRAATPFVFDPDLVIPMEGLADVEAVHRENGRTEYTEPIDLDTVVDLTFVDAALELRGPYEAKAADKK
ncbi:MAG TPA: ABC transporter substrate-binding protein [Phototrophicaceae bacterium]|nr:ABC transporter substrate-binding protein [Phototrophicaceae bacterium]